MGHYLKREFETLCVHRFSNETMPFFNLFKNCGHYWIIFGLVNMYFVLHTKYTEPVWDRNVVNMFISAFVLFESLNFLTHLTLRALRKPGTTERNIPHGWGFD